MKELCFDISTWQGGINYSAIKNTVNNVILRAGFETTKDNRFEEHYNNLQGLNLGAYWYSYAYSVEDARREAYTFLNIVKGKKFTLPLFLDIEDASMRGLSRDTLNNIVRAFGEIIEGAGYYFGVYSNLDWYRNVISGSELNKKYDWWIACWSSNAPSNVDFGVWQFTSDYSVGGWRVDANYIFKDYPSIIKNAGLNHLEDEPSPSPEPIPRPTPSITDDELLDLVKRTIRGDFGNYPERAEELGDLFDIVQNQVTLNYDNGTTNWDNVRLY